MIAEAQLPTHSCLLPAGQPEKPDKAQNAVLELDSSGLWLIQGAACRISKAETPRPNLPQPPSHIVFIYLNETYGYKGAIKDGGGSLCTVGHLV